jgi:hypothetical protein
MRRVLGNAEPRQLPGGRDHCEATTSQSQKKDLPITLHQQKEEPGARCDVRTRRVHPPLRCRHRGYQRSQAVHTDIQKRRMATNLTNGVKGTAFAIRDKVNGVSLVELSKFPYAEDNVNEKRMEIGNLVKQATTPTYSTGEDSQEHNRPRHRPREGEGPSETHPH